MNRSVSDAVPADGDRSSVEALPPAEDLKSLVLRTDFSDDDAWRELMELLGDEDATFVSDPAFDGVTPQTLIDVDADDALAYLFLADTVTMTDPGRPMLAVDLDEGSGMTFRVAPEGYPDVSRNLVIGNLDFEEFADAVDEDGTYRRMG
ncbi:hypothetical protein [Actinoplanes sp. NPDC049802]|uniref:DUF6924 domain-containing protein n=1 Tax=Actinoplanes sp. NPDC049802 TaxID=3154742 RepID=UPI0034024052